MYRKLLNKKFFRDNPVQELSTQQFVYSIVCTEGIEDITSEFVMEHAKLNDERLARIADEKAMIQEQSDPDTILQLLRKNIDVICRPVLVKRALKYENDIVPLVIEKLIRSDHDTFIENAVRILAKSKQNYSKQLHLRYSQFRSPYVKSLVCLLLGSRACEDVIPWMMDRFFEFQKMHPDDTFDQGPLLALYELRERFYA